MSERTDEHTISPWVLDAHVASGRKDPEIEAHLLTCARCRGYVAKMAGLAAPPAWNLPPRAAAAARPRPRAIAATPKRSWLVVAAGVTAIAAGALVWARMPPKDDRSYVGVKGTPATQLLVRRSGRVEIWDGKSDVRAGDALALRVACEGYSHVTVATPGSDGKPVRLFDGECATGTSPLPFTLLVDDAPGDERFTVVLSAARLDEAALPRATTADAGPSADVWIVPFLLHKGPR
jgi:hypothetical protein